MTDDDGEANKTVREETSMKTGGKHRTNKMNMRRNYKKLYTKNSDCLLTECEVCRGNYLPEVQRLMFTLFLPITLCFLSGFFSPSIYLVFSLKLSLRRFNYFLLVCFCKMFCKKFFARVQIQPVGTKNSLQRQAASQRTSFRVQIGQRDQQYS